MSTKTKVNKELTRILTPEFRVSYPHVFKAQSPNPKDAPKFSITMLFPKETDLTALKEVIKQAKIAAYGAKENWPEGLSSPVINGDDPKFADKEGYAGHWVIKATTNEDSRPVVVDENNDPIIDASKFYAGCYARAYIFARVWEYMGKRGVHFILDGVQKSRDGKSFGGRKPADQMFAPLGKTAKASSVTSDDDMDFT